MRLDSEITNINTKIWNVSITEQKQKVFFFLIEKKT